MDYTVIRTRNRKMSLTVDSDLNIKVKAPLFVSEEQIDSFVKKNEKWIKDRIDRITEMNKSLSLKPVTAPFIGEDIAIRRWDRRKTALSGGELYIRDDEPEKERAAIIRWYRDQAENLLNKRTAYWSEKIGDHPEKVRVSSARKRWGSCSSTGTVSYSWRLITAPASCIDYVIIHELCHIRNMDHSPEFWARVRTWCPEYEKQKKILESCSKKLMKEGWM